MAGVEVQRYSMEPTPEQATQGESLEKSNPTDERPLESSLAATLVQMTTLLPEILSKIFGRRLAPNIRRQVDDFQQQFLQKLSGGVSEALGKLQAAESESDRILACYRLIDVLLQSFVPDIPVGKDAFGHFVQRLEAFTALPTDLGYLNTTLYMDYRDALLELARNAYTAGLAAKAQRYLETVDSYPEDMLAICQSLITKLSRGYKFLAKPRRRFTQKMAGRCIDWYAELAGQFEKGISVVVGLVELLQGREPSYMKIRKRSLATNVAEVKKSSYSILACSFDILLRNAIAHRSYVFNPIQRMVEFNDRGKTSTVGYSEVAKRTQELSAAVLALSQLRFMLVIEQLRSFEATLSKSQSGEATI